jgi:hypothetical protein
MPSATLVLTNSGSTPIRVQITKIQYDVYVYPGANQQTNKVNLNSTYNLTLTRGTDKATPS